MIRSALLVTVGVGITAFMSFWAVIFFNSSQLRRQDTQNSHSLE